jgi:AAA family ATP:ADP antiporter
VFGFIAAGGSLGALCGPLISTLLMARTGHAPLFLVSGRIRLRCVPGLLADFDRRAESTNETADHPMSGNPFTGLFLVIRTPFLQGYGLFILLLSGVSTFLYFQQAELVRDAVPDNESRTQLFAWVDFAVNTLSIGSQLFLTGNIVKRFGFRIPFVAIPVLLLLGFVSFALYPMLSAAIGVMMVRRIGEYAFIRPCREMLFTSLSRDMKYKAKNVIDIVVYRGADALNSWFFIACQQFGLALTETA